MDTKAVAIISIVYCPLQTPLSTLLINLTVLSELDLRLEIFEIFLQSTCQICKITYKLELYWCNCFLVSSVIYRL